MNRIFLKLILIVLPSIVFLSCDLDDIDNYDGPNASIQGGIYDEETGELVEQDIINGVQIEYIEHGFENPQTQYQVVKNDGTFQNKMMFAGTYTMRAVRGNFVPTEDIEVKVKGNTEINFKVQPYIRIKNASIEKENGKIVATFSIQQTLQNKIKNVALFAHKEKNVGDPLAKTISVKQDINDITNESMVYTLTIDPSKYSEMKAGEKFYFRIGALMDVSEAKYNYVPAVRIDI
ncbi:DUF3823 domain-containing protein [Dysgonomonas massiliensis]|uniref:DUF3823 domain-containing protein n=1 Tax=Dysgonomonas massiliensis TaxID=2040292 RepID=UPI000C757422|nr:DUF3823 domain-containing protein [Dysgonomonas massiliensis]